MYMIDKTTEVTSFCNAWWRLLTLNWT